MKVHTHDFLARVPLASGVGEQLSSFSCIQDFRHLSGGLIGVGETCFVVFKDKLAVQPHPEQKAVLPIVHPVPVF